MDVGDVTISSQAPARCSVRIGACAVALSVAGLSACGGAPPTDSESLEGAGLVAGTSLPRHGLLVVPRAGGPAQLRSAENPERIRWSGTAELPATRGAYPLGRHVVLHAEDGSVLVFQPSGEVLERVGDAPGDARWVASDGGGAFVWDTGVLAVTPTWARRIAIAGGAVWAAPASDGRVVVLVEIDGSVRLQLWSDDGEAPAAERSVSTPGPALVTGWGSEVLLASGEDGRTLVGLPLPDLEPAERLRLDRAPVVLASSPSKHRLYAASASDARIETIDRYGWETVGRTRLDEPVRDLRSGFTGDVVLAFDGSRTWGVRTGETDRFEVLSDWRIDLPIGLPGGAILGVSGGRVLLFDDEGENPLTVEGPADAWWLPVRWTPRGIESAVAADAGEVADTVAVDSTGVDDGPQALSVGLTTVGRVAGRALAAPSTADIDFVTETPDAAESGADPFSAIPDGFYAVATSARELESLQALRRSLEGSGYPTEVLTRRDEANELWYRLMVGPYRSRADAESTVSDLQRERGISAWIHEAIGGGP